MLVLTVDREKQSKALEASDLVASRWGLNDPTCRASNGANRAVVFSRRPTRCHWGWHYKAQLFPQQDRQRAVSWPKRVMKQSFPARAPEFKTLLLLPRWPSAARVVSQRRINSSTTTTKTQSGEQTLFSLSPRPQCFTLLLAWILKSQTRTHTKAHTHTRFVTSVCTWHKPCK